jgi:hypothetical protein
MRAFAQLRRNRLEIEMKQERIIDLMAHDRAEEERKVILHKRAKHKKLAYRQFQLRERSRAQNYSQFAQQYTPLPKEFLYIRQHLEHCESERKCQRQLCYRDSYFSFNRLRGIFSIETLSLSTTILYL